MSGGPFFEGWKIGTGTVPRYDKKHISAEIFEDKSIDIGRIISFTME